MSLRDNELDLTKTVIKKSNQVIEKALQGGKHLAREELRSELERAGVPTDQNKVSHLLGHAELDGIICSGVEIGGKPSFTLLEEWVPKKRALSREEGLGKLALRYFTSHGPATINDFGWWSGLSIREVREALGMVKESLKPETIDAQPFWLADNVIARGGKDRVVMLPGYDEFLISYKDRSAILAAPYQKKLISENGLFQTHPGDRWTGQRIWRRSIKKASSWKLSCSSQSMVKMLSLIENSSEHWNVSG
jgi:hypothetical protein